MSAVLAGLQGEPKSLPCKFLYDERGSNLFERICELDEYYLTRTELGIMRAHVGEMAAALGPRVLVVEYGSGSGRKTRLLLDRLRDPVAYVPIDIARDALESSARAMQGHHPGLEVLPVCADYTREFELPRPARPPARTLVYFPGSTIGNFDPREASAFLSRLRRVVGSRGAILIGIDLAKQDDALERAYDDSQGVTAAFNLNLLRRINRELGAAIPLDAFRHRALLRERPQRVEMHLVCERDLLVRIDGRTIAFRAGETIHTENSFKYAPGEFGELVERAGLHVEREWSDERSWFSVLLLGVTASA